MAEIDTGMNLYDMNCNLIQSGQKPMNNMAINNAIEHTIKPYLEARINPTRYFMLLCNEDKDYTIFNINSFDDIDNAIDEICVGLKDCINSRGKAYVIQNTEDSYALEFWIKDDEHMRCFFFFPYDQGVIEIG